MRSIPAKKKRDADKKLESLNQQICAAEIGGSKIITCPYCSTELDFNPPFTVSLEVDTWRPPTCCASFALATIAILQRNEQRDAMDLIDRISNKAEACKN